MSSQQQTPQDDVRECSNGCGFYGCVGVLKLEGEEEGLTHSLVVAHMGHKLTPRHPTPHHHSTAQTNYLCSKCFKDAQGATIASIEATPAPAPPANPPANPPSLSTTATGGPSALPALAREPSLDSATAATPSVIAGAVEEAKAVAEGAAVAAAAAAAAAVEEAPATAPAPVQKKRYRCVRGVVSFRVTWWMRRRDGSHALAADPGRPV